jgi:hypothetical protein
MAIITLEIVPFLSQRFCTFNRILEVVFCKGVSTACNYASITPSHAFQDMAVLYRCIELQLLRSW